MPPQRTRPHSNHKTNEVNSTKRGVSPTCCITTHIRYVSPEENRKNVLANSPQVSPNELQTLLFLDGLALNNLRDSAPPNPSPPSQHLPELGMAKSKNFELKLVGPDPTPKQIQDLTEQWIASLCAQFNITNTFTSTVAFHNFTGMGIGGKQKSQYSFLIPC